MHPLGQEGVVAEPSGPPPHYWPIAISFAGLGRDQVRRSWGDQRGHPLAPEAAGLDLEVGPVVETRRLSGRRRRSQRNRRVRLLNRQPIATSVPPRPQTAVQRNRAWPFLLSILDPETVSGNNASAWVGRFERGLLGHS